MLYFLQFKDHTEVELGDNVSVVDDSGTATEYKIVSMVRHDGERTDSGHYHSNLLHFVSISLHSILSSMNLIDFRISCL